ncbi:Peroxidase 55 [Cardamine amara subsp. amara]|uniref:Peroxidase n=1 Tax=Cardamine amara subsp. amara TaxID=228776 RepID=A0ABD1AHF1_CARAN
MDTRSDDSTKPMMMCFLGLLLFSMVAESNAQLSENYYASTCPNVELIVQQAVTTKFQQTFTTAPATLRMFFHDCFVEGCDASVLIASDNEDAERNAPDNMSLAGDGFDTVIKAKTAVEALCPGVVSCADILALAARDVVVLAGGPGFKVELGRRDGLVSKASSVAGKLPGPELDVKGLTENFASNGLSLTDMIALSGAHTIGFAHCDRFANRLHNFSTFMPVDPTLDPAYAQQLMQSCSPDDPDLANIAVNLDLNTPNTFDNLYYQNLVARRGLFTSDQALFNDFSSQSTVIRFANNAGDFNGAFISAMRKLGRVGVKVGKQGEIRRDCSAFN